MFAYLDAGTGSAIVGALAAGTGGIVVVFALYKLRFQAIFSKKKRAELDELRARQAARRNGDVDDATPTPVDVDR